MTDTFDPYAPRRLRALPPSPERSPIDDIATLVLGLTYGEMLAFAHGRRRRPADARAPARHPARLGGAPGQARPGGGARGRRWGMSDSDNVKKLPVAFKKSGCPKTAA